tara:strand:+ start:950 stop:1417 length:468 start_codon:yes stop_codon:yes gene_type:complete
MSTYENFFPSLKQFNSKQFDSNHLPGGNDDTNPYDIIKNTNTVATMSKVVLGNSNVKDSEIAILGQINQDSANEATLVSINAKNVAVDMKNNNPVLSQEMENIAEKSTRASIKAQKISNICQLKISNSQSYVKINRFQQPRSQFDKKMLLKWYHN